MSCFVLVVFYFVVKDYFPLICHIFIIYFIHLIHQFAVLHCVPTFQPFLQWFSLFLQPAFGLLDFLPFDLDIFCLFELLIQI